MEEDPIGSGGSSFHLIDVGKFLEILNGKEGMTVLDLGCGYGHYSFELAKTVGDPGVVHAIDLWEKGIKGIEERIREKGIKNIRPVRADVSLEIPLEDQSVDICLMATVLHDLLRENTHEGTLKEVHRVVKGNGVLAVIEFKVMEGPPGPPKRIRIDPGRTEDIIRPFGFSLDSTNDLGPYTYLSIYGKTGG